MSSVGLRPHTVYGPGRDQGLTSAPTAAMVAAARGEAYKIPFGGALQLQYSADAGEAFVRASEAGGEGASVHNLDGPVVTVEEIIAAIEAAAPGRPGRSPRARTRCRSRRRWTRRRSRSWSAARPRGRSTEGVAQAIAAFREA